MAVLPRQARDKHRAKLLKNTLTQAAGGGKERSMKWTQVRRKKETPHLSSSLSLWMKCDDDLTRQARDTRKASCSKTGDRFRSTALQQSGDISLRSLSYYTDNGAYYYYQTANHTGSCSPP
eukprot:COSAG06_NODE_6543_length_2887_cov_16.353659_1_plen_120_part_10